MPKSESIPGASLSVAGARWLWARLSIGLRPLKTKNEVSPRCLVSHPITLAQRPSLEPLAEQRFELFPGPRGRSVERRHRSSHNAAVLEDGTSRVVAHDRAIP